MPLLLLFPTTFLISPQCSPTPKRSTPCLNTRNQGKKTIRGFNKKGKSLEGGGREPLKRFPPPSPLLSSLRPACGKLTLKGAGELIRAGRGLAAALDPFKPGNDGFGGKPFSKAGDGFKVAGATARETDAGVYTHAGPEIGVASTKAFTAQISVLAMMALQIGHRKGTLSDSVYKKYIHELYNLPDKVKAILDKNDKIKEISATYKDSTNAIYLGRGCQFPVALEGALKLKEISYIHAEGYPAAEMKHGPIALIDENMPVFAIATNDNYYDKIVSNIKEIQSRKGHVIALVNDNDTQVKKLAEHVVEIPETLEFLSPLLNVIPLQLISYHIAVMRGCNVDMPRNLAKSVTVE